MKKILLIILLVCVKQVNAQLCYNPVDKIWAGGYFGINQLVSGDFNGDGKMDLALEHSTYLDSLQIFLGTGNGNFSTPILYPSTVSLHNLISADFNSDGKSDLANFDGTNISVLIATGAGTFSTTVNTAANYFGYYGNPIMSSDFNNDNVSDIAIISDTIYTYLGAGNGNFTYNTKFLASITNTHAVFADFNEDGNIDIASIGSNFNNVSVFFGTGTGSFNSAINTSVNSISLRSISCADFNGDNHKDIAVYTDSLVVLLGNGTGSFTSISKFYATSPNFAADFDGDGKIDLAGNNGNDNGIDISLGTGTGGFGSPQNFTTNTYTSTVVIVDFNGDSKFDLAVTGGDNNDKSELSILLSCNATTGINQLALNTEQINIYPNPASNKIIIQATDITNIQIFDMLGKEIKSTKEKEIDVSNFNDGVYFIQVKTNENIYKQKIIVQH